MNEWNQTRINFIPPKLADLFGLDTIRIELTKELVIINMLTQSDYKVAHVGFHCNPHDYKIMVAIYLFFFPSSFCMQKLRNFGMPTNWFWS